MTLKASIAADAATVFCNVDDFAEAVTYYPHRYFGEEARADRSINAMVEREALESFSEDAGQDVAPVFRVHVANSTTLGINSDEIDLGGDKLGFPPRDGKTAVVKSIIKIESQDPGMMVLLCQ